MPVPPRPIPRPHPNAQRPGQGVPRKLQTSSFDPRAELDLIAHLPRSLPNPPQSHSALRIIGADAAAAAAAASASAKDKQGNAGVKGSREMQLGELVRESKGRVKQATVATSLGFDFIPNPSVLALPDEPSIPRPAPATSGARQRTVSSGGLSATPSTPGLVAHASGDEDDLDDDWEHVAMDDERAEAGSTAHVSRDEDDDSDVIILGELELEDDGTAMDPKAKAAVAPTRPAGKKSYAAAAAN